MNSDTPTFLAIWEEVNTKRSAPFMSDTRPIKNISMLTAGTLKYEPNNY
jgi:hypothetical protein